MTFLAPAARRRSIAGKAKTRRDADRGHHRRRCGQLKSAEASWDTLREFVKERGLLQ